jgi:PAS domain S-box-containing protein
MHQNQKIRQIVDSTFTAEKKSLEQELYDTRFKLNLLLEITDAVHYISYRTQAEKSFYSDRWEKVLGFSPHDVADPLAEKNKLVVVDSLDAYEAAWESFQQSGHATIKYQLQHPKTKKRIWIEEIVHKKFDVVAEDEVWAGTIRDISGIEFYKEYIEESERRFKKIADSVPIMIWVSDENDVIVYNNETARQFFGLKEEDHYSVEDMSKWVADEYQDIVRKEWDNKVVKREPIYAEMPLKTAIPGEYKFLSLRAIPRFLKSGEFIGYIGATYDLTSEYRYKMQAETSLATLRTSEEKFRTLFENLELGVLEVDQEDRIIYTNEAFNKMLGYTSEEIQGKIAHTIFLAKQEEAKTFEKNNALREKGKGSVYELTLKRKDGNLITSVISGAPVFDLQGNVKGSVGIHWDVTKIRALEQTMREQEVRKEQELAEARLQAEDQQRYEIGQDLHDGVGQMLAYINVYIEMLKSKGTLTKKELKSLESALQNTIQQVRTLSRLLAPPELKDIGLRESIRELINSCSVMKKPTFKLEIYSPQEDYNLNLSKKRMIYRVVQELLNNTFKHAEADQVILTLHFDKKNFYLVYEDDGRGFDLQNIRKGIGLDSIQSRIKFHQGTLEIQSELGKGSITRISIPIG